MKRPVGHVRAQTYLLWLFSLFFDLLICVLDFDWGIAIWIGAYKSRIRFSAHFLFLSEKNTSWLFLVVFCVILCDFDDLRAPRPGPGPPPSGDLTTSRFFIFPY